MTSSRAADRPMTGQATARVGAPHESRFTNHDLQEYVGCVRVHTFYGEGTEKLPALIRAANEAGLDFLVVTDRNSLHYLGAGMEGWYGPTAVIVGEELAGEQGQCLALGIREDVSPKRHSVEDCLTEIRRQGGFGVLCPPHRTDDTAPAPEALEIWSFQSDWRTGLHLWNRWWRAKDPVRHLGPPAPAALARWDALLERRPTAALAGLEAHGFRRAARRRATGFTYRQLFDTLRMHLLLPPLTRRFFDDKRTILGALARGQGFLACDALAPARGFRFEIRCADGRIVPMGQEVRYDPPMTLRVRLPQRARVRLVTGGEAWFTDNLESFDVELSGAGVIRLEAHLDGRPWIFSNPVYLRPAVPEMIGAG